MMEGDHVESNLEKVKNQLEENLNKVRSQPWAQPLSTALETTGKLLGLIEGFVPGGKIIGGALSFAATLLDPQSPGFDVQTGLGQVEAGIHTDIERIFTEVESSNKNIAEEMTKTKDIIVDANFKVRQFSVSPLDVFFPRTVSRKWKQPTTSFFKMASRISSLSALSFKPVPHSTLTHSGSEATWSTSTKTMGLLYARYNMLCIHSESRYISRQ